MKPIVLAFAAVSAFGLATLLATPAYSTGQTGALVRLQATTPGTAQVGNVNVSGTVAGGRFAGVGTELTALNAANLTVGALSDTVLSNNVALRTAANTFTQTNTFNGFLGVRRNFTVSGFESFGIGSSASSWDGMYIRTAASGKPFYGYSPLGHTAYHYIDGTDANKWKLFNGGPILAFTTDGKLGVGTSSPSTALEVAGTATVTGFRLNASPTDGYVLSSDASGNGAWTLPTWIESGSGQIVLSTDNKVGIGTQSPWGYLEVRKSALQPLGVFENGYIQQYPYMKAGVMATARDSNSSSYGVYGVGASTSTGSCYGLYGRAEGATGRAYGVFGSVNSGSSGYGVYGVAYAPHYAGYFDGLLYATSSSAGVKSFLIDHPTDPENKLLEHSSVESDERLNLYRGQVMTDDRGYAQITAPEWFEALNANVQIQLTVVDDSDDFVLAKVVRQSDDGKRLVRTSKPKTLVNFLLTGVRKDPTSKRYPLQVEREKPAAMRGKYMVPEAYGYGPERGMNSANSEEPRKP